MIGQAGSASRSSAETLQSTIYINDLLPFILA